MWGAKSLLDRGKMFSNNSLVKVDELETGDYLNQ